MLRVDQSLSCLVHPDGSYITWRVGTGANIELTNIKAATPGNGIGERLFRDMLEALREHPPYHAVYGFTRTANVTAQEFYRSVGFVLSPVEGVYLDGTAVVFSRPYRELLRHNGMEEL